MTKLYKPQNKMYFLLEMFSEFAKRELHVIMNTCVMYVCLIYSCTLALIPMLLQHARNMFAKRRD